MENKVRIKLVLKLHLNTINILLMYHNTEQNCGVSTFGQIGFYWKWVCIRSPKETEKIAGYIFFLFPSFISRRFLTF